MELNNIICNNCREKGHMFSNCPEPITSYGTILFKIEDKIPKILMINRKDSLCYIEFIRGKYEVYDITYIQVLVNKFNNKEKQNIIDKDFDTLWKELWLVDDIEINKYKNNYNKSKLKFNKLKEGYHYNKTNIDINLSYFIDKSDSNYEMSEWEFPKGRRNNREKNIECAMREMEEETNYNKGDYDIIINLLPINEIYKGEDKNIYRHYYYIGNLRNYDKSCKLDTSNKCQISEISDIKWFTQKESLSIIRGYHTTRKKAILNMFSILNNLEEYIII